MADERFGADELDELRQTAAAADALAQDPDAFKEAYEAFQASDATRFQAALDRVKLGERCRLICRLFCQKRCGAVCRLFCPERQEPVDANEVREFALALAKLAADEAALKRLLAIIAAEDVKAWQEEIKR